MEENNSMQDAMKASTASSRPAGLHDKINLQEYAENMNLERIDVST